MKRSTAVILVVLALVVAGAFFYELRLLRQSVQEITIELRHLNKKMANF